MEHQPVLIERSGIFHFYIEELGLTASGSDVAAAHADLQRRYQDLLSQARSADLLDQLPPPRPRTATGGVLAVHSSIKGFAIKTAIVVAAVLVAIVPIKLVITSVARSINTTVDRVIGHIKINGRTFWGGIENGLHKIATQDDPISSESKERILTDLRIFVSRYRPYLQELRPLLFTDAAVCPPRPNASPENP